MGIFLQDLTRRSLLQSMGAVISAATLVGCSKDDGVDMLYVGAEADNIPEIPRDEKIIPGAFGHNCGGRCQLVAHVKNGVIRRFTSDERQDKNILDNTGDDPQRRACLRCRGKTSWIYRPDRVLYPLKQTGKRGDVSTFQRISWEQAANEIDAKMKQIATYSSSDTVKNENNRDVLFQGDYGKGAFINMHSTGDTSTIASSVSSVAGFINAYGASPEYISGMFSYPQVSTASCAVMGLLAGGINGNSKQDIFNSDLVINWGCSIADAVIETNTLWYMLQARERGVEYITVDTYVTRTATTLGGRCLCPVPGTDAAMIAGIICYIIEKHIESCGSDNPLDKDTKYIKMSKLKKYTFGFFENDNPKYYRNADGSAVGAGGTSDIQTDPEVAVPAGASYSAYIFGEDNLLVSKGMNKATSIYPDTIGYNAREPGHLDPSDLGDPAYGKRTKIYGQMKKTPAWAAKICGVPEEDIIWLAEQIVSNKTTLYSGGGGGGGGQRTGEGEQFALSFMALGLITGSYGENGICFGMSAHGRKDTTMYPFYAPNNTTYAEYNFIRSPKIHADIINKNRVNSDKLSYPNLTNSEALSKIQLYSWQDQAEFGGKGKSKWNDPNIMYGPPLRAMINCAGNSVNQSGDCLENIRVVSNTSSLDLVITVDPFMTPTAQYSDYVLPAAVHFEKDGALGGFSYRETLLNIPKAINAPGEAKPELEIFEMITAKSGLKDVINGGVTARDSIRHYYETSAIAGESNAPSFEEFEKNGIYTKSGTQRPLEIEYEAFVENPEEKPLNTLTGRFSIYSKLLMEVYEARRFNNFDRNETLVTGKDSSNTEVVGSGRIFSKACGFTGKLQNAVDKPAEFLLDGDILYTGASAGEKLENQHSARFVYPIPVYIPQLEGAHACDYLSDYMYNETDMRHPDPMSRKSDYPFIITTYHALFRSHSTNNNSPYVNETYKIGNDGKPSFLPSDRLKPDGSLYPEAWEDGVYEPVNINPYDAERLGIKDGDRVIVESARAKIYAAARVSKINRPGTLRMAEGAWVCFKDINGETIDVGGSASSLMEKRPSRIGQGAVMAGGCRVNIRKG